MKSQGWLLLLLATLISCFPIEWQGNVSLSAQYPFRFTSLTPFSNGISFASHSANVSSVDGVYGSAYTSGDMFPSLPPSWYLAFFESSSAWTEAYPINASVAKSSAYVGSTLLKLSEVDSAGSRFQSIDLASLMWSFGNITTKNSLSYATFTGEINGDSRGFAFKITAVVSSVVGMLNSGVIMTPQCMGSFIEIVNFPYVDSNNSLELTMGFVTSLGNVSTNDTIWITSDRIRYQYGEEESASAVYYDLSLNVMVYGDNNGISDEGHRKIQGIELRSAASSGSSINGGVSGGAVTGSATLADLNNIYMANQVKSMVNPEVNVALKQIVFPPGVHTLTYTTVVGMGVGPSLEPLDATTDVNKTFLAFLTVMGLLSVFLLASACGYFVRYRKELARGVEMKRQTYSPLEVE